MSNSTIKRLEAMNKKLANLNKLRFISEDKNSAEQAYFEYRKVVDQFMLQNKQTLHQYIHAHDERKAKQKSAVKSHKMTEKTLKQFFDVD